MGWDFLRLSKEFFTRIKHNQLVIVWIIKLNGGKNMVERIFEPIKAAQKAKVGLYTIGHPTYWVQFEGLEQRLTDYGKFIGNKLSQWSEVFNFGMIDCRDKSEQAGRWFNENNVDLLICFTGTYAMSADHIATPQICKKPVIVLNLQPSEYINYEKTTTGEWLANCGACCVPEISNAFARTGIDFRVVSGLLGLIETPDVSMANEVTYNHPDAIEAWSEIEEWLRAASAVRTLQYSKMGFLGHTYPGMLDMYSDFTMIQGQTGIHVEILEMCDLEKLVNEVSDSERAEKLDEIEKMFIISEDSPSDPLAKKPTDEQLEWSSTLAVAQEKMVKRYDLDALTYYYRGLNNNLQHIQEGFILGHSLLTAKGIPCSGEGDMKTAIAMKICDILDVGGSFCEIIVVDFKDQTLLLGHDGPFHIAISDGKPVLRGLGLFHGKSGSGVSVEATVKKGDITTLGLTQTKQGKLKMIVSQGVATNGPVMNIGNTMTPVKFAMGPRLYMNKWFMEGPTHHCAMSLGKNASLFEKVANLMGIEFQLICE